MKMLKRKNLRAFILGMLTFAVGYFIASTFIFVERPSLDGVNLDWGQICFWPGEDGISATVSPKGCYSTSCTRPIYQSGTAIVDRQSRKIQFETRFVLVETSRFPLPCTDNCEGGGTVFFNLGNLIPNNYEVWFRDEVVGELDVTSGLPTPSQCLENAPEDATSLR